MQLYKKLLYCEKISAVFIPGRFHPALITNGKYILDYINT